MSWGFDDTPYSSQGLTFSFQRGETDAAERKPIVFTDHAATADIMKATSLSSSSTDKLNLRLIRASQYVSQYDPDIRWRPGKQNVVPDALSRLLHDEEEEVEQDDEILSPEWPRAHCV